MACLYCGGEVPIRMRLTGEARFCSPEHKRLYNEEHSRLGLERLLEEFSTKSNPPAAAPPLEPEPVEEPVSTLPEPELVYSGRDLRLWTYNPLPYRFEPKFETFLAFDDPPAVYAPGKPAPVTGTGADAAFALSMALPKPAFGEPEQPEEAPPPPLATAPEDAPETTSVVAAAPPPAAPVEPSKPAAPTKTPSAPAGADPQPAPPARPEKPAVIEAPSFGYAPKDQKESASGAGGKAWKIAAGVLLAVVLGGAGYWGLGLNGEIAEPERAPVASAQTNWDQWIPGWSESSVGEEIALFSPSQKWSDYRVQWLAESSEKVSWVYRAVDPRNYHALLLEKDARSGWRLMRYTVVDGRRTAETEMPLKPSLPDGEHMSVQLEVKGSRFTLFLEGHNVAEWSDNRLERGGFGIMRPDPGLAGVGDVKVTQLNRESASQRRFWKGDLPERLPEVTMLRHTGDAARSKDSAGESTL